MTISFNCPNGHKLKAESIQAGKSFRCGACGAAVTVPTPAALDAVILEDSQSLGDRRILWIAGTGGGVGLALVLLLIIGLALSRGGAPAPGGLDVAQRGGEAPPPAAPDVEQARVATEDLAKLHEKLRTIGIAFHNFHDTYRMFAPPQASGAGEARSVSGLRPTRLSWRVHLLPFLNHGPLYQRFRLDEPWDSPHNKALLQHMPEIYRIGASDETTTRLQVLTGPDYLFGNAKPPRMQDAADGTAHTILAVVVGPDRAVPWTMPDELELDPAAPLAALGALPDGLISCVMVDASPLTLPDTVDAATFLSLATPRGNEVADASRLRRQFEEQRWTHAAPQPQGSRPVSAPVATRASASPVSSHSGDARDKLRAIGRAMLLHNQFFGMYTHPASPDGGEHVSRLSWRVHLLPYLGESELYERFHLNEPWDSPHNRALLKEMPDAFRFDGNGQGETQVHIFSGPNMLFGQGRPATSRDIPDGLSATALAVVLGPQWRRPWTDPADMAFERGVAKEILRGAGGGTIECLMADGALLSLPGDVSADMLEALITPAGGEVVDIHALQAQYGDKAKPDAATGQQVRAVIQVNEQRANKLKSVALAMHNYHDVYRRFPLAQNAKYFDAQGRPHLSWRVHLLPFLDQQPLYARFKLDEPWDSPNNRPLLDAMPDVFRDPEDAADSASTRLVVLTGPETLFSKPHGPRFADVVDGTASTLLVLLAGPDRAVPWTKPEDAAFDPAAPMACLGQPYGPGFSFVTVDGAVRHLKRSLPPDLFTALVTPLGKETIPPEIHHYGQLGPMVFANKVRAASAPGPKPVNASAGKEDNLSLRREAASSDGAAELRAVVGRPAFKPPADEPIVFHPPPLDPEPVPDDAARAQLASEDRIIAKALAEVRSKGMGVFVRFEPAPDGSITALINAGATPDDRTGETREQRLTFGNGIPLVSIDASWSVETPAAQDRKLVQSVSHEATCALHRMRPLVRRPNGPSSAPRKLLWSPDGSQAILLTTDGQLLQIDAVAWEVVALVRPERPIRDISWSSQGLVALHSNASSSPPPGAFHWEMIEPSPGQQRGFEDHRLLVLDPATLQIRRALHVEGAAVAGHPDRDLVYVHQPNPGRQLMTHPQRLLVVNVAAGELVNMVSQKSLAPQALIDYRGPESLRESVRPVFDELRLIRSGRVLLSINNQSHDSSLHRFVLAGPHITCASSVASLANAAGSVQLSEDGGLLGFPVYADDPYPSTGQTAWLQIVRSEDIDESVAALPCPAQMRQFALDSASKSIVFAAPPPPITSSLETPSRETSLRLLQDELDVTIPLGEETPLRLWPHSHGRGVVVVTDAGLRWLEFSSRGERWAFERTPANALPMTASDATSVEVSRGFEAAAPRFGDKENRLEIPLHTGWIAWAPDGSAYYALVHPSFSVARFDAQTNRETHRLEIPIPEDLMPRGVLSEDGAFLETTGETPHEGPPGLLAAVAAMHGKKNVVPRAFMTEGGVLFDHKFVKKLFLLDLQTLQPIWELDAKHADGPIGRRDHGLIVARSNGGLVVFEAATGRVHARASLFEIARQWPESCRDRVAFVLFGADPTTIQCYRDRLATFRIEDRKLKYVDSEARRGSPRDEIVLPEPPYQPQGFKYRQQGQSLYLDDPEGGKVGWFTLPARSMQVAPHPQDPHRVLVRATGGVHVMKAHLFRK